MVIHIYNKSCQYLNSGYRENDPKSSSVIFNLCSYISLMPVKGLNMCAILDFHINTIQRLETDVMRNLYTT
jgi:hypothetical protein